MLTKEQIQETLDLGYGEHRAAKHLNCNRDEWRYWKKKHGLDSVHGYLENKKARASYETLCKECGKHKSSNWDKFYTNVKDICCYCKHKARRRAIKECLVEEFGGKCNRCGYDKSIAALEFHHKDPNDKDFLIGYSAKMKLERYKEIRNEALKCELLCSNCHREEHFKMEKSERLDAYMKLCKEHIKHESSS